MFGKDESITLQAESRQKGSDDLPPQRFEEAEPDTQSKKSQDPQEALKDLQGAYDNLKHDYEEAKQKLYVNRGFGFLGFPGRVGIMPEITVFELKR